MTAVSAERFTRHLARSLPKEMRDLFEAHSFVGYNTKEDNFLVVVGDTHMAHPVAEGPSDALVMAVMMLLLKAKGDNPLWSQDTIRARRRTTGRVLRLLWGNPQGGSWTPSRT